VGGGGIQTFSADRTRIATAAGALAIAGILAALPVVYGGDRRRILAAFAVAGIIATVSGLAGKVAATWWAVAILGAEYAVFVLGRSTVDVRAPVVGAGLLVLAELAQWSLRARVSVRSDTGMGTRQLVDIGVLWLGSLALGSLVVAVGDVGGPGGLGLVVAGIVACSATLGLVFSLTRRRPGPAG
jgi:hypothetical protein